MRAIIHDPGAPAGLRLGAAPDPVPGPTEALVAIESTSLNWGEVAALSMSLRTKPGDVPGWDRAGVVIVRGLGSVTGRRVLVTGASGGVGRLAVQLAAVAGAEVVAAVRSPERAVGLSELGANEVVVGLGELSAPVYGVIDGVGGPLLAELMTHLEDGAVVQWIANSSMQPTELGAAERGSATWQLHSLRFRTPVGADLAYLMRLLNAGRLDPQIAWRGSWERASEAAQALLDRQIAGKAVLDLAPANG